MVPKLILNSSGKLVAAHVWGSPTTEDSCPIDPPPNGSVVDIDKEGADILISLMAGGQVVKVESGVVTVDGDQIGTIAHGKLTL